MPARACQPAMPGHNTQLELHLRSRHMSSRLGGRARSQRRRPVQSACAFDHPPSSPLAGGWSGRGLPLCEKRCLCVPMPTTKHMPWPAPCVLCGGPAWSGWAWGRVGWHGGAGPLPHHRGAFSCFSQFPFACGNHNHYRSPPFPTPAACPYPLSACWALSAALLPALVPCTVVPLSTPKANLPVGLDTQHKSHKPLAHPPTPRTPLTHRPIQQQPRVHTPSPLSTVVPLRVSPLCSRQGGLHPIPCDLLLRGRAAAGRHPASTRSIQQQHHHLSPSSSFVRMSVEAEKGSTKTTQDSSMPPANREKEGGVSSSPAAAATPANGGGSAASGGGGGGASASSPAAPTAAHSSKDAPGASANENIEGGAADKENKKEAIRAAVERYLSLPYLQSDGGFLASHMNPQMFIPLPVVASLPDVDALTQDLNVVVEALANSAKVMLGEDKVRRAGCLTHPPTHQPTHPPLYACFCSSNHPRIHPPTPPTQNTALHPPQHPRGTQHHHPPRNLQRDARSQASRHLLLGRLPCGQEHSQGREGYLVCDYGERGGGQEDSGEAPGGDF